MAARCDIVIPVWNMRDLTERCVDSIMRNTKFPYGIIIVDNASENETRDYLRGLAAKKDIDVTVIRNEENLGNSKAANQGMRASRAEYVCILDNDTIVTENWLTEMVNTAERDSRIAVVNPLSNYGARKPRGKSWDEIGLRNYRENKGNYIETAAAIGFCFLIKRGAMEKIGVWSEAYGPGYFEDTEYSVRAINNGYKVAIAEGAYVAHLEHASFKKTGSFDELFKRNQKLFYEQFGRSKRLLYIVSGRRALDIGASAYENARNRHWVWVFTKRDADINLPRHAYIRLFRLNGLFFQLNCLWRVLIRKKKFDLIYSDSPRMSEKLRLLRPLHKAEVAEKVW